VTAVADEIEALERRGWEALSGPDGAEFYTDLLTDDGLMVFPGAVLDRAQSLQAIAGATPWATYELEDIRVVAAPDAAVITYHATAQRTGEAPYRALMSSVFVRPDDRWRLALHQQTPDPARD
jgi:uncharacterized protein (TIGR02246 family)